MWEKDPMAGFEQTTLPNGLEIFAKHYEGCPFVATNAIVKVGSRHDPFGKESTAHLTEHMVSKNLDGYEYQAAQDFFRLQGGGVKFGTTHFDATEYEFFCALKNGLVEEAWQMFGNMLVSAKLQNHLEREREAALQEISTKPEQFRRIDREGFHNLFHELPDIARYYHSVENISAVTLQDVQDFYGSFYIPANIRLISVGGMSLQTLQTLLMTTPFGSDKPGQIIDFAPPFTPTKPLPVTLQEILWSDLISVHHDKGIYNTLFVMPGECPDPLMATLRSMLSKTLFVELRDKRAWVYSADVAVNTAADFYQFKVTTSFHPSRFEEGLEKVVEEILQTVLQDENLFEKTREIMVQDLLLADNSLSSIRNKAASRLSTKALCPSHEEIIAQYQKLQFSQLQDLAQYVRPEMRHTVILKP